MAEEAELKAICGQLVQAVEVMMNPGVGNQERFQAYQKCEEFKQSAASPVTVQCGLLLTQYNNTVAVRRFGLKLLEDVIKLRWNEMSGDQKMFMKVNVMGLMMIEEKHEEPGLIKDGIARLCVEMILSLIHI